jgi:hypothetical protein
LTLRFSEDGPAFPTDLIDRMIEGDVVFLCGAGVSAPQVPMFGKLVDCVYKKIGIEPTAAEALAIKNWRYEEALGAVSRRLANPARIYSEVTSILTRDIADLSHHKTLLRLSRARDNRLLLVTTNFECLFERAVDENEVRGQGKALSLAGQALPPPGSEACHGIIHLHGRTRDAAAGLDATPLVLTSAEYGDAYMRSGWASRFLFDLVRCKTLVLVGYSANDAPVRYFLNLLEGDRDRFEDLRTVYALDSYETDAAETEARWATIAVTPLPYRKGPKPDEHRAVWTDLASLAELVEQPRRARQARTAVFRKPFSTATASELEEAEWLLAGKADLWDLITAQIEDPAWFGFFRTRRSGRPPTRAAFGPTGVVPGSRTRRVSRRQSTGITRSGSFSPSVISSVSSSSYEVPPSRGRRPGKSSRGCAQNHATRSCITSDFHRRLKARLSMTVICGRRFWPSPPTLKSRRNGDLLAKVRGSRRQCSETSSECRCRWRMSPILTV